MNSNESDRGVVVLAGLFESCGDIGTQCRYDLLPIPWEKDRFTAIVARILKFEMSRRIWDETPDQSPGEVGLKAWICLDNNGHDIKELLIRGWSDRRGRLAGLAIDHLSFNEIPIKFSWMPATSDEAESIMIFERLLLNQLEDSAQANV